MNLQSVALLYRQYHYLGARYVLGARNRCFLLPPALIARGVPFSNRLFDCRFPIDRRPDRKLNYRDEPVVKLCQAPVPRYRKSHFAVVTSQWKRIITLLVSELGSVARSVERDQRYSCGVDPD